MRPKPATRPFWPILFLSLLATTLPSCIVPIHRRSKDPSTAAQVLAKTTVKDDLETGTVEVGGPFLHSSEGAFGLHFSCRKVPSTAPLDSGGVPQDPDHPELYLSFVRAAEDWLLLESARDIDGNSLPSHVVHRRVDQREKLAALGELLSIDLGPEYVRSHRERGIQVKLYGRRGQLDVVVPSYYVQGFLEKLTTTGLLEASAK